MSISISITPRALKKLNYLDYKARAKFVSKIRCFITQQAAADQIKKMHQQGNKNIFRIRYNLNQRIIARLVKISDYPKQIRILDFISHDEMDKGQYSTNDNNSTLINLDTLNFEIDEPEDPNSSDLTVDHSLETEDFDIINYDFFLPDLIYPEYQTEADLLFSPEQYAIVKSNLPILLTGSAGSGKTTIAVYQALQQSYNYEPHQKRILYVTYSRYLKEYAKTIARSFGEQLPKNLDFYDYDSLCLKISIRNQILKNYNFDPNKKINQQKFIEKFWKNHAVAGLDPMALWQEIRHLIKGSAIATANENNLITEEEYINNRHLSTIPTSNYQQIYNLSLQYQSWLISQGFWDEVDITHKLVGNLQNFNYPKYEAIYCDEVQDLTEIQIKFLLQLLQPSCLTQFFFTGDPAQIINPSGFKWNKIKSLIYQQTDLRIWQSIKDSLNPKKIKINFRSSGRIAQLGQQVLKLSGQDNDSKSADSLAENPFIDAGKKPLVIYSDESSIIDNRNIFGAWNAIVVTNENDKQQLVRQFTKDNITAKRILTIQEIKGLEFNELLVWNFFSTFDSWSSRNNQNIQELLAFKYNCLYVCITRAKHKLYFYESKKSDFWTNPQIEHFIEEGNHSSLDSFFSINQSSEEWLKSAKEFELQGAYEQAKENYQRIGLINDVLRMDALLQEKHENWEQAGDIWDSLSQWDKAMLSWFKVQPDLYRKKWQQLNQAGLQQRANYLQRIFEDNENFELAEVVGDIYRSVNNYPQAKYYYELAELWYIENNQLLQTAQVLIKLKQWRKAAKLWEELQAWQDAAEAWEKVDEFEKAAIAYTKQKNWEQAGKFYAKSKCWLQAETSWKQVNNWKRAAKVCEKQGKLEEANKLYRRAKCWLQAARLYQRAQQWEQAASLYEQEKCWHQAQKCWIKVEYNSRILQHLAFSYQQLNQFKRAAKLYEQVGCWQEAEDCWRKLNQWLHIAYACEQQFHWQQAAAAWKLANELVNAAVCFEKAESWVEALECWRQQGNWECLASVCERQKQWQQAAKAWKLAKAWENAAKCYQRCEYWAEAQECWQKLGNWQNVALTCVKQQKWQQAAAAWVFADKWENAAKCYQKGEFWAEAQECWRKLGNWQNVALTCVKQNKWEEAAQSYEIAENWQLAAKAWLRANNLEKAAQAWEKGSLWVEAEDCWRKLRKWENVAHVCQQQGKLQDAAQAWELAGAFNRAAESYQQSQLWWEAEQCWRKTLNWGGVGFACVRQQKWQQAAVAYKNAGAFDDAAQCYEQAQLWAEAEKCWRNLGNWQRVAFTCQQQNKWEEAAQAYENAKHWQQAAQVWLKVNQLEKAAKAYETGEFLSQAEQLWRQLNNWERVASVCQRQLKWRKAAEAWKLAGKWKNAAECYEKERLWAEAEQCWMKISNWKNVAIARQKQDRWQNAAEAWKLAGDFEKAAECYEKNLLWAEAEYCWRKTSNWDRLANACYLQNNGREAAQIWEENQSWHRAAIAWEQVGEIEKAAMLYEKAQMGKKAAELWLKLGNRKRAIFALGQQKIW